MEKATLSEHAVELGAQIPGQGQIPLAPVLDSDPIAGLVFTASFYVIAIATVAWVLWRTIVHREALPFILLLAGAVAVQMEPFGDAIGLIVYAPDLPWFDYWLMGRQMPSFIPVALLPYITLGGYYMYKKMEQGCSIGFIMRVAVIYVGVPEIVGELLWHHWGIIDYYGNPTTLGGIPLYTMVQNSMLLPVLGVTVLVGARYLQGAQLLWLIPAIPGVTIGYIVGVSWPVYVAIQSSAPAWVSWAACIYTCVCSIAAALAVLKLPMLEELRRQPVGAANPVQARSL